ncbi:MULTISPECIES: class I SAM-dependent methyltransferase [Moorena]|uniref:Methyltransferase type 11 domain-containing protein n=1 Tax=Moorena bouillonii PNG TaxID=568701 RepID=A0A1U7N2V2_9CYAN|nr:MULTISPECIES: class I SAM-dependent methyltransferase [Moorena]NEP26872.1 class I SAM-dependent methyltransferase [Moorena sp. SIO3I6]OLT60273.1 hypothetical protein BJP37_15795 [Moorena bouillonii PNG]
MTDWDTYAKLGILQAVIDPSDNQGFKNRLIDQIQWRLIQEKLKKSKKLLDFGCGTGRFAPRITNLGIEYTGIDSSENMIQVAKDIHQSPILKFIHFNGVEIPFPDNSFDTCLSSGVFQYLIKEPNCQKILSEIRRVLVPGGCLIMDEQVSLSNQTSASGMLVLTELDYKNEISNSFSVKSVCRVRGGYLSKVSHLSFRVAKLLPWAFDVSLDYLAQREIRKIKKVSSDYLSTMKYYEVLIESETK